MIHKVWEQFVTTKMPEHREFVLEEVPRLLSKPVELKNPSAHGKMPERKRADQTHQIVLGRRGTVGLLERLSVAGMTSKLLPQTPLGQMTEKT